MGVFMFEGFEYALKFSIDIKSDYSFAAVARKC